MPFEITILGSGAALPTAERNPSSQYINCNDRHILIDCGEGTQNQIRRFGIRIQRIKYIFISHLHGDHYFGLVGLLSTMNLLGRDKDIHLFGPPELKQILDIQVAAGGHKYGFNLHFTPLSGNEEQLIFEDRLIEVYSFPLDHRIPAFGFVIREKEKELSLKGELFKADQISLEAIPYFKKGIDFQNEQGIVFEAAKYTLPAKASRSYAYLSDTAPLKNVPEILNDVSAMYHEATFVNADQDRAIKTKHCTAAEAAQLAQQINSRSLYLGHISSRYNDTKLHHAEASEVFTPVKVVQDGDVIKL